MKGIKMYKDGSRLTIVIENCDTDINQLIGSLVTKAMGCEVEPVNIQGVEPPVVNTEKNKEKGKEIKAEELQKAFVFKYAPLSGLTAKEAAEKMPVAIIKQALKNIPITKYTEYKSALQEGYYLAVNQLEDEPDKDKIIRFISSLKYELKDQLGQLFDNLGFDSTIDDFIETVDDMDILSCVYASLINYLKEKQF